MKTIFLVMLGVLAMPALAQEPRPTPKPEEGAKAEQPAQREAEKAAVKELRDRAGARVQWLSSSR